MLGEFKLEDNAQKILVHIEGDKFSKNKGYDLETVSESLVILNNMLQKVYMLMNDTKKEEIKDELRINLLDVREGSFLAEIGFFFQLSVIALLPLFNIQSPQQLWETIVNSFKYLKQIISLKKSGKNPTIVNNGGVVVVQSGNNNSNTTTYYPQGTDDVSEAIKPNIGELSKLVKKSGVNSICFGNTGKLIDMDTNTGKLFSDSIFTEDNIIEIQGKFFEMNVLSKTGKIEVTNGNGFLENEKFNVKLKKPIKDEEGSELSKLLSVERIYQCQRCIQFYDSGTSSKIKCLKILDLVD